MTIILLYLALGALVVLANRGIFGERFIFDPDDGSRGPGLLEWALYPKPFVHLTAAYILVDFAIHKGGPWPWVVAVVALLAVAYEWSQRVYRWQDLAGGVLGIVLALYACGVFP